MTKVEKVFQGSFVHSVSIEEEGFQILRDHLLGVYENGTIAFIEDSSKQTELESKFSFKSEIIQNLGNKFLIPGFIDTHLHAPQYPNAGTGTDLPLLEWLERYTFPMETKFSEEKFAEFVFTKVVRRTLSNGTTTGCYFATIHLTASKILAKVIQAEGQRAFVGKVNMDRNSPSTYIESTEDSLKDTRSFLEHFVEHPHPLLTPIITPRFVPTCSPALMEGLGKLAKEFSVPIQSHISENKGEIEWVKALHPELSSYAHVYDHYGLFNNRTVMAHGIHLSDEELKLCHDRGVGIAHCPVSNFDLHSGILNVRRVLKAKVKIGLGTDISGGHSPSILETIRQALIAANSLQFFEPSLQPINYKEAFAFATIGGAQVLGLENVVGNFMIGKAFDALVIDPFHPSSSFDVFETNSFEDIFQKFIMCGDQRNIETVFVNGKELPKYY